MYNINTLADLKRLPVGAQLTLIDSLAGRCNMHRTVAQVMSNQIRFTTSEGKSSWLSLPKAKDFRPTGRGFIIMEDEKIAAEYVFGHSGPANERQPTLAQSNEGPALIP